MGTNPTGKPGCGRGCVGGCAAFVVALGFALVGGYVLIRVNISDLFLVDMILKRGESVTQLEAYRGVANIFGLALVGVGLFILGGLVIAIFVRMLTPTPTPKASVISVGTPPVAQPGTPRRPPPKTDRIRRVSRTAVLLHKLGEHAPLVGVVLYTLIVGAGWLMQTSSIEATIASGLLFWLATIVVGYEGEWVTEAFRIPARSGWLLRMFVVGVATAGYLLAPNYSIMRVISVLTGVALLAYEVTRHSTYHIKRYPAKPQEVGFAVIIAVLVVVAAAVFPELFAWNTNVAILVLGVVVIIPLAAMGVLLISRYFNSTDAQDHGILVTPPDPSVQPTTITDDDSPFAGVNRFPYRRVQDPIRVDPSHVSNFDDENGDFDPSDRLDSLISSSNLSGGANHTDDDSSDDDWGWLFGPPPVQDVPDGDLPWKRKDDQE